MAEIDWALACFPQHEKTSGAAAVMRAADDVHAQIERGKATRCLDILVELDHIDEQDQTESS